MALNPHFMARVAKRCHIPSYRPELRWRQTAIDLIWLAICAQAWAEKTKLTYKGWTVDAREIHHS
jgi:hypothetical protein